jgi:glycosyltransferase involved in cell wall biosynthesis
MNSAVGPEKPKSVLGISFDGLAISGIINEFLNVAAVFRRDGFRILLDLGYDITIGRTLDSGRFCLPSWVAVIRCIDGYPHDYSRSVVEEVFDEVVAGTSVAAAKIYDGLCRQLTELLLATFIRENVHLLIIENGTLPDNPLFTEALYMAIAEYGDQQKLGKYVLWRDHDLMWSAEPHLYGAYPYPGVRKPEANQYIHYAVATEWMRTRMQAWAPSATYHIIPNRFFLPDVQSSSKRSLRAAYGIPQDAYLIARCTRVIPQKSIERDLRLIDELQLRLSASKDHRKIFLFVTGPTKEDPAEFERLRSLEKTLSIAGQVIWGDGLLPFNPLMIDLAETNDLFAIYELLAEADLSSFLTSYDYEGFGNPPGESMAAGVPFVSTTYELYHEVYGSKGAVAPLLPISRSSSPEEPIPESFILWSLQTLTDSEYRAQVIQRNREVCRRFFSLDVLERQLHEIFKSL